METVYLIRDRQSQLVKIGITGDWGKRARQLKVGSKTDPLMVVLAHHNRHHESRLHEKWAEHRLPQTEWFCLDEQQIAAVVADVESLGQQHPQPWIPQRRPARPCQSVRTRWLPAAAEEEPCFWGTPEGREQAADFHHNLDEEALVALVVGSPWVLDWSEASPQDALTCPGISLEVMLPQSLGGQLEFVSIDPGSTPDGEYVGGAEKWLVDSFTQPPAGLEETLDRLWLLMDLPEQEMPLRVIARRHELARFTEAVEKTASDPSLTVAEQTERLRELAKRIEA